MPYSLRPCPVQSPFVPYALRFGPISIRLHRRDRLYRPLRLRCCPSTGRSFHAHLRDPLQTVPSRTAPAQKDLLAKAFVHRIHVPVGFNSFARNRMAALQVSPGSPASRSSCVGQKGRASSQRPVEYHNLLRSTPTKSAKMVTQMSGPFEPRLTAARPNSGNQLQPA